MPLERGVADGGAEAAVTERSMHPRRLRLPDRSLEQRVVVGDDEALAAIRTAHGVHERRTVGDRALSGETLREHLLAA